MIALSVVSTPHVHAGVATGNSTEWTQIANFVRLVYSGAKEAITAANTAIDTAKNTVGNPFLAAMITGMQQQAAKDMNNWARGNFQGNSSVITNPEQYIKNVGLEAARGGLTISMGNGLEDKILGAVVTGIRGQNTDLAGQLTLLAKSDLPSLIKSSSCNDATLNQLVASEGLVPGTAEFNVRKNQLYNNLCVGDPVNDPALARRLTTFGNNNPIVSQATGLDSILLMTSGQNPYAQAMRAADATNQVVASKKATAAADLASGNGNASKRECVKYAQNDDEGNAWPPGTAPCLEYKTTTSSGQVNVTLNTSLTAGIDRLTNLGPDGFASLLGRYFMQAINNSAVNFVLDNNDAGGRGTAANTAYFAVASTSGVSASLTNTPITSIINRVYVQDLINDPQTKNSLTTPIFRQLTSYSSSLDELEQTNADYGTQISEQQTRLNAVRGCFDSIVRRYSPYGNNPDVIAAYDKIKVLQDKLDTAMATITSDTTAISTARTLISTTRDAVTRSNSSAQINDLFAAYQNALDGDSLPTITASSERMALFEKLRTALQGPSGSTKDLITILQEQCTTLEQQIPVGSPDVPPTPVDTGGGAGDGGSGGY